MFEWLMDLGTGAPVSTWVYLGVLVLAAVDGFFPVVPSESAVISVGVVAATGSADLAPLMAAAAAGAVVGDHASYLLGRLAGDRLAGRAGSGTRRRAAVERAGTLLARRGSSILIVGRYVPGGRTATTLAAGTVRYRLRSFTAAVTLAGVGWAVSTALIGYVGGRAFHDRPLLGIAVGIGFSVLLAAAVELGRHLWGRWTKHDRWHAPRAGQGEGVTRPQREVAPLRR
jgi:membrane protein DedA with SNARE-associated domain